MSKRPKLATYAFVLLIVMLSAAFILLRIHPLLNHNVGYTYDQGRDFLKAAEIVLYKNITFIGPTTGIMGLYHGAWWYYFAAIPFIVFSGWPMGFYYTNLALQLGSMLIAFFFFRKHFSLSIAILVSLLISTSPYFIFTSLFVGNNIMAIPSVLFFLIVNFILLEQKKKNVGKLFFLSGLALAFVAEFELAFGLFIIPSYLVSMFAIARLRAMALKKITHIPLFLTGVIIPFIPRALFELKNGFNQTKILLGFAFKSGGEKAPSFFELLLQRIDMFRGFYRSIFAHEALYITITSLAVFFLIYGLVKKKLIYKQALIFNVLMLTLLLVFSAFYKESFWSNYYEGIQYVFIFILALLFFQDIRQEPRTNMLLRGAALFIVTLVTITKLIPEFSPKSPGMTNLRAQEYTVERILKENAEEKQYCVKIYTPPIVPYTYQYLFLYNRLAKKTVDPSENWINKTCWFIIERDDYEFRVKEWRKIHIEEGAQLKKKIIINKDVVIEKWQQE